MEGINIEKDDMQHSVAIVKEESGAVITEINIKADESLVKRRRINSAKQIIDMGITETPMLVEGLIPKYGISSLAGSSDLGKSYLLMQLLDAIINNDSHFLGFNLNVEHAKAIYVSTEDDVESLCPRLTNLSKNRADKNVYERLGVITSTENMLQLVDLALTKHPADLVVFDTFADMFEGDMNQSNKVRSFLQKFKELASKHKTHFIFNHHCGKKNDLRAPHKDNLLGSQGYESAMRTVIELRKDFSNPDIRHLCVVKANYLDETSKNRSYALNFDYRDSGFTSTGIRVPFEQLVKPENGEQRSARDTRILQLKTEGNSISQITAKMNEEGFDIGRTTVGNICKVNPSIQTPQGEKTDGQEKTTAINKKEEILKIQSFLKVPITDLIFGDTSVQIFSDDIDLGVIPFSIVGGAVHYENLHQIETRVNWEKIYERHRDIIKSEIRKLVDREDLYISSTDFRECDICTDTRFLFTVNCEFTDDYWQFSKKSNIPTLFGNSSKGM